MVGAADNVKQHEAPLTLPSLKIDSFTYKPFPAVFNQAPKAIQGLERLCLLAEECCVGLCARLCSCVLDMLAYLDISLLI